MNEKQSVRSHLKKQEENQIGTGLSVLSFKQLVTKFERIEPKVMSVKKSEMKKLPATKLKSPQVSKPIKFVLNKPSTLPSRTLPARNLIKPPVKPNELRNNKIIIRKKVSTLKKPLIGQNANQVEKKIMTNDVIVEEPIEEVVEQLNPTNSVVELNEPTELPKLMEVLPMKRDESNLNLNVDDQLESRLSEMKIISRQPSQPKIHEKHRKRHHRSKYDDKTKIKDEKLMKNSLYSIEKSKRNKKVKSKKRKSFFTICRLKLKQFFTLKK